MRRMPGNRKARMPADTYEEMTDSALSVGTPPRIIPAPCLGPAMFPPREAAR